MGSHIRSIRAGGPAVRASAAGVLALAAGLPAAPAAADSVVLVSDRDNTLIQPMSGQPENSLGAGWQFYAGRVGNNGGGTIRRGLLRFDLSSIPPGSTITAVKLKLYMSQGNGAASTVSLKRCLADWGEGVSFGFGGGGAPAEENDATWTKRFYPGVAWGAAGGSFSATASASTSIPSQAAFYTWGSTAAMVADAKAWHAAPGSNFGWVVTGNEATIQTSKRFESRDSLTVAQRPQLTIWFVPPSQIVGDLNVDGAVNGADLGLMLGTWGQANPSYDLDGSGTVDGGDLGLLLAHWT